MEPQTVPITDWWTVIVAAYAAIVATGALFLEVRRWFEAGPRLTITVAPEMILINVPGAEGNTYLFATVTNRGSAPTTISGFHLFDYENWFNRLRSKPKWAAAILHPHPQAHVVNIPKVVQPGEVWEGAALYEGNLKERIERGWLYVIIYASHADKPMRKRVRPRPKLPADTQKKTD
jgi:hypothetical protein